MINPDTMQFLAQLTRHPTKEWLEDHREDFAIAKCDLLEFVAALLHATSQIDNRVVVANANPRKSLGGILGRNIYSGEFSLGVRVSTDPKAIASYFVKVRPGGSYSGGGSRTPVTRLSRLLRQQMMTDTGRWREIVEGPVFRKFFPGGLSDGVATKPTKGFAKNHDAIDSLNLKGFAACMPLSDQLMQSGNAVGEVVQSFAASRSLVDYINRATTK